MASIATLAKKKNLSRRMFARIGVGGIAAAAALVATEEPASALCPYLCCRLAHCPGSYSYCVAHKNYIWGCYSGSQFCQCCEANNNTYSAIKCS
jgi:hypothetical protein